jgi:hypothetical protein
VTAARRLGLEASPAEIAQAWEALAGRVGGTGALDEWLERAGIEAAWARAMVAADVERRRFVDVRLRAFAFVSEDAVLAALGPGPHDATRRASTRERLERQEVERALARWIEEGCAKTIRHPRRGRPWPACLDAAVTAEGDTRGRRRRGRGWLRPRRRRQDKQSRRGPPRQVTTARGDTQGADGGDAWLPGPEAVRAMRRPPGYEGGEPLVIDGPDSPDW